MTATVTLDQAPLGVPLVLIGTGVEGPTSRHLTALGLRRGVQFSVVLRLAGGGRVVAVRGGRIAVGREVLAHLHAEAVA